MYNNDFGVDRTQQYSSDHNYPMPQNIAGHNKYFGSALVGAKVQLWSAIGEFDFHLAGTFAFAYDGPTLTVPAVGTEKIVSYDVESTFGSHLRATFTVRIATSY